MLMLLSSHDPSMPTSSSHTISPPVSIGTTYIARQAHATSPHVAHNLATIGNLPEHALEKLSGARSHLGRGLYGSVSRQCFEMPSPPYITSAARFLAVKEHDDPVLGKQSDHALRQLAALGADGLQHILSAKHIGPASQVGMPLANMSLADFLDTTPVRCMDALVTIRDLSLGLDSLHACGFTHGDISARNVLVTAGGYMLGDVDGTRDGVRDFAAGTYPRSEDLCDLSALIRQIFSGIPIQATISGAGPSEHAAFYSDSLDEDHEPCSAQVMRELVEQGRYDERNERLVREFSKAMSALDAGLHDEATLVNLASIADELVGAFRGNPSWMVS